MVYSGRAVPDIRENGNNQFLLRNNRKQTSGAFAPTGDSCDSRTRLFRDIHEMSGLSSRGASTSDRGGPRIHGNNSTEGRSDSQQGQGRGGKQRTRGPCETVSRASSRLRCSDRPDETPGTGGTPRIPTVPRRVSTLAGTKAFRAGGEKTGPEPTG
jgi:hypothetical protein